MDPKKIVVIGAIEKKLSEYVDDGDKKKLIDFVVRSIEGNRLEQAIHIHGSGNNGKSTFINWMRDLLKENNIMMKNIKLTGHQPTCKIGLLSESEYDDNSHLVNLRNYLRQNDRPNLIMMSNVRLPDNHRIVQIEFTRTF
jgi:hypothetical protein